MSNSLAIRQTSNRLGPLRGAAGEYWLSTAHRPQTTAVAADVEIAVTCIYVT